MKNVQTRKPKIYFAAAAGCEKAAAETISRIEELKTLDGFEMLNIGARALYSAEYNIKHFSAFHVGNLIAKHVGEFDDTLGVIFSTTGGGANLFASRHAHIRASIASGPYHAQELRTKMIANVITIPVLCTNAGYTDESASMIASFAKTDISRFLPYSLVKIIKPMTHRNNPLIQWLWIKYSGFMVPRSALYKKLMRERDAAGM